MVAMRRCTTHMPNTAASKTDQNRRDLDKPHGHSLDQVVRDRKGRNVPNTCCCQVAGREARSKGMQSLRQNFAPRLKSIRDESGRSSRRDGGQRERCTEKEETNTLHDLMDENLETIKRQLQFHKEKC